MYNLFKNGVESLLNLFEEGSLTTLFANNYYFMQIKLFLWFDTLSLEAFSVTITITDSL